jgi:cytochrome P450
MALHLYLEGLVRQYRDDAPAGVIGVLAQTLSSSGLTAEDVYMSCFDFVVAGYLSTTFLITSAINALFDPSVDPGQRAAFAEDESVRENATKELLRYEPPLQLVDRYVREPHELGETKLRAGDKVTAVIGSADRDDTVFDRPDTLDIYRAEADRHMSFGEGIHRCIGEPLAMRVAPIAIAKLLQQPGLAVNGVPQWLTDPYLRGMSSLPARFDPKP